MEDLVDRRHLRGLLIGAVAAVAGCGGATDRPSAAPAITPTTATTDHPQRTAPGMGRPGSQKWSPSPDLLAGIARAAGDSTGPAGVVVLSVRARGTASAGPLRVERAWSTIKVPLLVAYLDLVRRRRGAPSGVAALRRDERADAGKMITMSANEPANRFFLSLAKANGGTAGGARVLERVLRRGGDARTRVIAQRPDGARTFTWLGQTRWALRDGAGVYAALQRGDLAGRADTRFVLGLMRRVAGSQWGLRTALPSSIPLAYKVGVGQDPAGATTAEQYGIVGAGGDACVIAVAARAADEASAKAAVDRMAAAATGPVREGGGCGADG